MSLILPISLLFGLLWFKHLVDKYDNPYKLIIIFGKKGSGKTTDICKKSFECFNSGIPAYCTEPMPGTYHIDYTDIGVVSYPRDSAIFIDEVGMLWDNREYKTFPKHVRNYFKLQRHYGNTVYMYSQHFDIDKKLRDLCDELYIAKSYFNVFAVYKKIRKDLTIVEASGESESRITDDLKVLPWFLPGARKITYLPKYHKYFDSFAAPELEYKEYKLEPVKLCMCNMHFRVQLRLALKELCFLLSRLHTEILTFVYRKGWIKWL